MCTISRKSMISSTLRRCSTSSRIAGPKRRSCQTKPLRIFSVRPAMMLSSVVMLLNRATFWNVRAMPPAAAVRPDDGADLAFADVEGNVGERLHAAEGKRDILGREQDFAGRDLGRRTLHAAFPSGGADAATGAISRILMRAAIVPLRPSSKVTSVLMSTSLEPS